MAVKHLGNQIYTGLTADTKPTTAPSTAIFINTQTAELFIYDGVDWDLVNLATATVADDSITNAKINSAAAIAYSKLNLATSIVNADISASAGIVKSKLAALNIVNADVDAAAAIAKSKLASLDVVNADVNASAAIAVSKLAIKQGSSVQSGDGTTTVFNIAHSLGATPTYVAAETGSDEARGTRTLTKDGTNIIVTYAVAPPTGTNNLTWLWKAS